MSVNEHDRDWTAIESALKTLQPAAEAFDREQLFFRAGQASVGRRRWLWPGVAGALTCVTIALAGLLVYRPTLQTVRHVVHVRMTDALPPDEQMPVPQVERAVRPHAEVATHWTELLRQREQLLRWGPHHASAAVAASLSAPLPPLERQLGFPAGALRGPQFHSLRVKSKSGDSL